MIRRVLALCLAAAMWPAAMAEDYGAAEDYAPPAFEFAQEAPEAADASTAEVPDAWVDPEWQDGAQDAWIEPGWSDGAQDAWAEPEWLAGAQDAWTVPSGDVGAGFADGRSEDISTPARAAVSASIPWGEDPATAHNADLAAQSVYDTPLASGDVFSFNDVVGPRTAQFGYISAVNGRGARVVGGGVAQVASVIWLAVKSMPDVAILEKSTYGESYNQRYVQSSSDAILTDYDAGIDFSFTYTGEGSITIFTWIAGGALRCDIAYNG